MHIVLFENKNIEKLYPITLTRPSFDILCGGVTLQQLLDKSFQGSTFSFLTRNYLNTIVEQNFSGSKLAENKVLMLDGALVPSFKVATDLAGHLKTDSNLVFKNNDQVVGTWLDLKTLNLPESKITNLKFDEVESFIASAQLKTVAVDWPLLVNLWDVVTQNENILSENLENLKTDYKKIKPNVYVGKKVKIDENVVLDGSEGLIVIGDNTWVKSFSILRGPLFIGRDCIVNSFSELKHGACIGPVCKVGGEVEVSIIQGYSNKQHAGFLGGSYVGSWVNLGGGTSNSDLKNTYSNIKMMGQDTGKKFLGCIIGDYCKTAINTAIFTGKVIGPNSLLYGVITKDVPAFTNAGSMLKKWVACPLELAQRVQQTMFERRGKKPSIADQDLLKEIYNMTEPGRNSAGVEDGQLELIS